MDINPATNLPNSANLSSAATPDSAANVQPNVSAQQVAPTAKGDSSRNETNNQRFDAERVIRVAASRNVISETDLNSTRVTVFEGGGLSRELIFTNIRTGETTRAPEEQVAGANLDA